MKPSTYPGRTLSAVDLALNVAVLAAGGYLTFRLLMAGSSTLWLGLVMGVVLVLILVIFVYRFTKAGGSLKVGPEFVAFGGERIPLVDVEAVERGPSDPGRGVFWVYLRTARATHRVDLGRYQMDDEEPERVVEELRAAAGGGGGARS